MKQMKRKTLIEQATAGKSWDVIVIGGGASGLGTAVDAASRGYRTLLLEQADFAKATSSRSTKLVHGGVRYLQQGNISLAGVIFVLAPLIVPSPHDMAPTNIPQNRERHIPTKRRDTSLKNCLSHPPLPWRILIIELSFFLRC